MQKCETLTITKIQPIKTMNDFHHTCTGIPSQTEEDKMIPETMVLPNIKYCLEILGNQQEESRTKEDKMILEALILSNIIYCHEILGYS